VAQTASDQILPERLFSYKERSPDCDHEEGTNPQVLKATLRSKQQQKRQNILEEDRQLNRMNSEYLRQLEDD
jgi:hypothetical protein